MINETKLMFDLGILKHFINNSLGLSYEKHSVTGFELIVPLLESAAYNTYIETVSNKAKTLYLRSKKSLISMMKHAYLNYIKRISEKFELNKKSVILAFDYTDEDFYGNVQGLDIHGWTKKDAVTGHFKFLTCSIISDEIPQKIPLISTPIRIGHYKSHEIMYCLSLIKDYIGKIDLILFDKEFCNNELMYDLKKINYPYLIFVPRRDEYKKFFKELDDGLTLFVHNYEMNRDKTNYQEKTYLAFLKQIYDPRLEKNLDWIFSTNVEKVALGKIIMTYKKRWRIETQFRVQDEARIKCKSKEMKIRYFLFMFEQMLQTIWICFYKDECSFKEFLIAMAKMSRKWTKTKEA